MFRENDIYRRDEKLSEMMSSMTIDVEEKNTTLIWFNPDNDSTEHAMSIRQNLGMSNNEPLFPVDVQSCIDNIKRRNMDKIILVISADNFRKLPSDIINVRQMDSIFIFPENRETCSYLRDINDKIVEICSDPKDLMNSIEKKNRQNKKIVLEYQRGTRSLTEQSSEILWYV